MPLLCIAALLAAMSFKIKGGNDPIHGKVVLHFQSFVGNDYLLLDSAYTNAKGQQYTISRFKYYIGNIRLRKADGKEVKYSNYYLINEEDEVSKLVRLNVKEGEYTGISFILGVDSARNCSGAQTGALDPANGMFWAWNTGYIFMKLDGKAQASKNSDHLLEFHIGGYKEPSNCIRQISLDFKGGPLKIVTEGKQIGVQIKTDVSEIFKTPTPIDFATVSSVTNATNATMIADNYADMFSVLKIEQ